MILVITNSRRFAVDKLMSTYGMKPPFKDVLIVDRVEALADYLITDDRRPIPGLLIWQRGRMSKAAEELRDYADDLFAAEILREATSKEP